VDLESGEIRIEQAQAKGKKPRTVPVYGDVAEWLVWQLKRRRPDCELVFHYDRMPLGSHLKGWAKACTEVELAKLHFHDLRRSAVFPARKASNECDENTGLCPVFSRVRNMERAGIPRNVAMQISGHKTEGVYRRHDIVAKNDLKSAGEKLEAYHRQQVPKLRRVK
jgi:integrase